MRFLANIVSYIFHPIFLFFGLTLMAFWIDRFGYYIGNEHGEGALLLMNFFMLIVFPCIAIAVMAGLGMISSIKMPEREDRIGPLIFTLAVYIWFFINVKDNALYPDTLRFAALGGTLAVGVAFFVNNFSKISLHAVGAAAFTVGLFLLVQHSGRTFIDVDFLALGQWRISAVIALMISVVMTGLVGSARLYLTAHHPQEVIGGYVVGALTVIAAFRIMI